MTPEQHAAKLARDRAYSAAYYLAHHDAVRDRQTRYRADHWYHCREQASRYYMNRRFAEACEYLHNAPPSFFLGGVGPSTQSRGEKLRAMAAQTASPIEAAIARRLLAAKVNPCRALIVVAP
jgi:hypothetical protein